MITKTNTYRLQIVYKYQKSISNKIRLKFNNFLINNIIWIRSCLQNPQRHLLGFSNIELNYYYIIDLFLSNNNKYSLIITYCQMHQDLKQNAISKAVIKFIDIVLDLYSPVPYQIRNQMRVLQTTLLYGHHQELNDYIQNLRQKLAIKQKYKHCQTQQDLQNSAKSANKLLRNPLSDSDKQNKFYLTNNVHNLKPTSIDNTKKNDTSFSSNLKSIEKSSSGNLAQFNRTRKPSAIDSSSLEQEQAPQISHIKSLSNKEGDITKNSSRALLKIIKRNKSGKDQPLTDRSISKDHLKAIQSLKINLTQIIQALDKTQIQLGPLLSQANFLIK